MKVGLRWNIRQEMIAKSFSERIDKVKTLMVGDIFKE